MIISRSFAIIVDPNKFDSYNELRITRMSSVLPFFLLCPNVYARLFKISGVYGRKKIRVERISPYFLGKKIEMFQKGKASLSKFEQMEGKFLTSA